MKVRISPAQAVAAAITANFLVWALLIAASVHYFI